MCTGEPALVPGELRGYRQWRCVGPQLLALNIAHGEWIRPELEAVCRRAIFCGHSVPAHQAPDKACGCGIYGWYGPDSVWRQGYWNQGGVFGVIAVSGRVLLGDYGFRAQRARIVALAADVEVPGLREYWTSRGVEVFGSRAKLIAAYPPDDVGELLGHEPAPEHPTMASAQLQLAIAARAAQRDFEREMKRLTAVIQQHAVSVERAANALRRLGVLVGAADVAVDKAMQRALERKRQGTRGPEKRRRGRARLSL
jgi:hypothetical protein